MQYRQLGKTDLEVSSICLGTMQFGWTTDEKQAHEIMSAAVDLGCNFFDTADVYSSWHAGNKGGESEEIIGSWLSTRTEWREKLVIATKVRGKMGEGRYDEGLSRAHIQKAVDASLTRLRTDYIDLYQVHWPDEDVPIDETLQAMDDLVIQGKVRYIGCSNFTASLLSESLEASKLNGIVRFESLQPHYNYIHRAEFEEKLMALCSREQIGVISYSPLARGFLTGKYRPDSDLPKSARSSGVQEKYMNRAGWRALENLEAIGVKYQAAIVQMAIAWVLANEVVTSAIIGANSIDQLHETIKGASLQLSQQDKRLLDGFTAWNQSESGALEYE